MSFINDIRIGRKLIGGFVIVPVIMAIIVLFAYNNANDAAAEEQAASVEEVTASVNEVGGLMQSTTREATDAAAASEESSAAIDQITKVVANVNTIIDKVTKEVSTSRVQ